MVAIRPADPLGSVTWRAAWTVRESVLRNTLGIGLQIVVIRCQFRVSCQQRHGESQIEGHLSNLMTSASSALYVITIFKNGFVVDHCQKNNDFLRPATPYKAT